MNRRPFLHSLAVGGAVLSSGCVEALPFTTTRLESDEVFDGYRYEDHDLIVQLRDDVDITTVTLVDSSDDDYDTVDHPIGSVRFPVVFPDRLETYLRNQPLRVRAETSAGDARLSVWEPVHGAVRNVTPLADGRARLEIENQGGAPLLVRFLGIYGDVPNPTVDLQADDVDRSALPETAGIVGVDENQPLSPSRTDLVIAPGETEPFETTYAPFAFPDDSDAAACDSDERRGTVAVAHGAGGTAAYGFSYRLGDESAELEGRDATVCGDSGSDE